MVISGGVNIYPSEIEQAMVQCPGVRDCAMFGIPDEDFGETLMALVEAARPARQAQNRSFPGVSRKGVIRRLMIARIEPRGDSVHMGHNDWTKAAVRTS